MDSIKPIRNYSEKNCSVCKIIFKPRHNTVIFCSDYCKSNTTCKKCDVQLTAQNSTIGKYRCCKPCFAKYKRDVVRRTSTRICIFCKGPNFTAAGIKFCTKECRFKSKCVFLDNGCWNWPKITIYRLKEFNWNRGCICPRMASLIIFKEEVFRKNLLIQETCKNEVCVNPDHLLPNHDRTLNNSFVFSIPDSNESSIEILKSIQDLLL